MKSPHSPSIKSLEKEVTQARSKLTEELRRRYEAALTPQVTFLLKKLKGKFLELKKSKDGILHITGENKWGTQLETYLTKGKVAFSYDSETETTQGRTVYPDPYDRDTSFFADPVEIPRYDTTTHSFIIDPTQKNFEERLKKAVLASLTESRLEEIGGKLNRNEQSVVAKTIEHKLEQDLKRVAGRRRA